jgi:hypothetical protein
MIEAAGGGGRNFISQGWLCGGWLCGGGQLTKSLAQYSYTEGE